jgi:hypothetical protein
MWTLTMAAPSRKFDARLLLAAVISGVSLSALMLPTSAQAGSFCSNSEGPCFNDSGSNGGSIKGIADQRFNQIITNRVLGTVLLGVNEQVNCSDCVSGFGSAGSFSAGIHGRKEITQNLSILAGLAYTQYGESGYKVTDAPIGAFALRYDFTDWGSSRPFFDVGAILTPFEKVSYSRNYSSGQVNFFDGTPVGTPQAVATQSSTNASDYGVYARAGWITRLSPRDEIAGSVEVWQLWQTVNGYTESTGTPNTFGIVPNPFNATIATGTDRTNLAKVGAQWTHLFGDSIETNVNGGFVQSFGNHSGLVAAVTGYEDSITPVIGNQYWFEYGGRVGYRITQGWTADLFLNGTAGPQPVGFTLHGGLGLRVSY